MNGTKTLKTEDDYGTPGSKVAPSLGYSQSLEGNLLEYMNLENIYFENIVNQTEAFNGTPEPENRNTRETVSRNQNYFEPSECDKQAGSIDNFEYIITKGKFSPRQSSVFLSNSNEETLTDLDSDHPNKIGTRDQNTSSFSMNENDRSCYVNSLEIINGCPNFAKGQTFVSETDYGLENTEISNQSKCISKEVPRGLGTPEDDITILEEKNTAEVILSHVERYFDLWKREFPWVEFHDLTRQLSCNLCTADPSDPQMVWSLLLIRDIGKVAKNLLHHAHSDKHVAATIISSQTAFNSVYYLLKTKALKFLSSQALLAEVSRVINWELNIDVQDHVIVQLMRAVAITVENLNLNLLREKSISLLYDSCRKILIARLMNDENHPVEKVITNFPSSSSSSLIEFTRDNSISVDIILNPNLKCKKCQNDPNGRLNMDDSLPVRFPFLNCLIKLLVEDTYMNDYCRYVCLLSGMYKDYTIFFCHIEDSNVLVNNSWFEMSIYKLLKVHNSSINAMLSNIYRVRPSPALKKVMNYVVDTSEEFYCIMDLMSCLDKYLRCYFSKRSPSTMSEIYSQVRNKVQSSLKLGAQQPYAYSIHLIASYFEEIQRFYYYSSTSDFFFYFNLEKLSYLWNSGSRLHLLLPFFTSFKKIYFMFRPKLGIPCGQLFMLLLKFGHLIYECYKTPQITLFQVSEMFKGSSELREEYFWVLRFYTLLGALPTFSALVERSFFNVDITKRKLRSIYGKEMGDLLLAIHLEGPDPESIISPLKKYITKTN